MKMTDVLGAALESAARVGAEGISWMRQELKGQSTVGKAAMTVNGPLKSGSTERDSSWGPSAWPRSRAVMLRRFVPSRSSLSFLIAKEEP